MILAHTAIPVLTAFGTVALANLCALIWMLTIPRQSRRTVLAWSLVAYAAVTGLLFYLSIVRFNKHWFFVAFYGGAVAALVFGILGYVGRSRRNG